MPAAAPENGVGFGADAWPPVRHDPRPEARTDLNLDDDEADEGGWLGPAVTRTSTSDIVTDDASGRRFDDLELLPSTRHRGTLLAVLVGVAILAVAGAAVLMLTSGPDKPTAGAQPAPSPASTRFISAQATGEPRDIRIAEDKGTTVTLNWTDPTAGTVTFVVVGSGPAGEKLETKPIDRGTHTATYTQLSPKKNYCFVVGAVYAVDRIALAHEVCTKR